MGTASKRFTILTQGSIIILFVTGYLKTPTGMLFNTTETYGMTWTVKHVLVLSMIVLASLIMLVVVPTLTNLSLQAARC